MATKIQAKKKGEVKTKSADAVIKKSQPPTTGAAPKATSEVEIAAPVRPKETAKEREMREQRQDVLHKMLLSKRQEIIREIEESLGQSLTEDQQRRLESARDVGDQALMDLERELGISLMEMRNRRRQSIDEAITRLHEGTYGICAECGVEISEKRLQAVPFAKLCVECQSRAELLEKIEREEDRD
ncbi:TraR/DksA family transcriptional regulator [Candidatus Nitrospira nitrificans]|uniref:DnaK suppressor protein (Modular protein) n=1 Tax=Candidatus Nitrospira nitrificans TaxID=1742973 RepID=A0A0S4LBZ4_9BACT|nr:TraR/DksA family transcriptional regulator [Candidatus Nitrospira nitrificans]CUS33430.1 DnaK suppressor protein (Modular protein) [Candidatus Nitrospira nitrificans]